MVIEKADRLGGTRRERLSGVGPATSPPTSTAIRPRRSTLVAHVLAGCRDTALSRDVATSQVSPVSSVTTIESQTWSGTSGSGGRQRRRESIRSGRGRRGDGVLHHPHCPDIEGLDRFAGLLPQRPMGSRGRPARPAGRHRGNGIRPPCRSCRRSPMTWPSCTCSSAPLSGCYRSEPAGHRGRPGSCSSTIPAAWRLAASISTRPSRRFRRRRRRRHLARAGRDESRLPANLEDNVVDPVKREKLRPPTGRRASGW